MKEDDNYIRMCDERFEQAVENAKLKANRDYQRWRAEITLKNDPSFQDLFKQ